MQLRKGLLFAALLTVLILTNSHPVRAADSNEVSLPGAYDFQNDPFLLDWTFNVEKAPAVSTEPVTLEDKLLARWKEKQAALWNRLPTEPFQINASAYTAAADECGKNDGVTASGLHVEPKRTLACPKEYPFGTKISIEGLGEFRCEDRGGAIHGNKFDIYMQTKGEAFSFGRRTLTAQVIQ